MAGFNIGLAKDANLSDLANLSAGAANLGLSAASLDIAAGLSSLNIQSPDFSTLTGSTGNVQAQLDAQRATLFGLLADTTDYLPLGGSALTTASVSGTVAANLFLDASLNPVTTSTDSLWYSSTAGEIEYPARVEVGGTLHVDSLSLPDAAAISDLSNLAGDYGFIAFNKALGLAAGGNTYRALVAPGPTVEQYFKDDKSLINRVSQTQVVTYTRASKALYRNAQGLFTEAADGEPRFDHDANGQCLGLLIEPQRTNYIRYSELTTSDQFSDPQRQGVQYRVLTGLFDRPINAAYFPPSIFGMDGPNGLTGTNSNATRSAILTFFTATSFSVGTLAISFYLYSDEVPLGLNVFLVRNNGLINLSSFLINRFDLGGGLYRYAYVYPWSTLGTSGTLIGIRVSCIYTKLSGNLFVGPNKGFYVFGGQLESGSFVTSYIRTTGAQATRAADALSVTGAAIDTSGTVEAHVSTSLSSAIVIRLNGSQDIDFNYTGAISLDGVRQVNSFTFTSSVVPSILSGAGITRLKYDGSNALGLGALGAPAYTQVAAVLPSINALLLFPQASGHVRQFRYWPFQCSDNFVLGGAVTSGSPTWTPAALGADLVLWLDASDTSTITLSSLNNNTVSQVADKSSNGRNVSSLVASEQAIYDVDGLNNKPTLVFDGINDFMSGTDWWLTEIGDGAFSVFHVFESSSDDFGISVNTANATGAVPRHYFLAQNMSYNTQNTLILDGYDNSAVFQEWSYDGVQTLQMRRNGGAAVSATQSAIAPSQGFYAFPFKSGNVAQPGKSSEHVVVKGSISATDRQNLGGYFAHKWGITAKLPANHPYKTTPPAAP